MLKTAWSQWRDKQLQIGIFVLFMLVRIAFKWGSGYDNFELFSDSQRYDELSNRILAGNFDLEYIAFLVSPLYPWFLALVKFIFGIYWQFFAVLLQFILIALSGVYLYKIAKLLFDNQNVALFAAIGYCFFPLTLWFNFTFTQETLFQALFIFAIYYLFKILFGNPRALVPSAIFFSLAFLTKSHILLFSPFIVLLVLVSSPYPISKKVRYSILYGSICLLLTLPYGLYTWQKHGVYVLSSNGGAAYFFYGHNAYTYQVTFFPKNTDRNGGANADFLFDPDFEHPGYGKINRLPQSEKSRWYWQMGLDWIRANPRQFWQLEWFALERFFLPGLSFRHYTATQWWLAFLCSLPVYLLGYIGIVKAMSQRWQRHWWIVLLMFTMLLIYLIFSPQSRFRTITLEPFYALYAAYGGYFLYKNFSAGQWWRHLPKMRHNPATPDR